MNRSRSTYLASISFVFLLSYGAVHADKFLLASQPSQGNALSSQTDKVAARNGPRHFFLDQTQEIVRDAVMLVEENQRDGAPLDQRWYAFRRFGEHLEKILAAKEVRFYGGTEADVLRAIADQYISVHPIEPNQDPGEIRLFLARRDNQSRDLIIIGQNGKEVALKTVIRLAYLFKFMDQKSRQVSIGELFSFLSKVKIYLSARPPRQEFISFFHQYRISDPDTVVIGFEGDSRAVLRNRGMGEPKRYSNDSLRVNWYPGIRGKKVLLVSINGNRIYASRAGEFIRAMLEDFSAPPRSLIFFGSAGAIDSADLVGRIVAPTVVSNEDSQALSRHGTQPARAFNNRAAMMLPISTAHVSVESLTMETMTWAKRNKKIGISTVDQELYHVINALNASPHAAKIHLFVSLLVTDNVSSVRKEHKRTLKRAEDVIAETTELRRDFLAKLFAEAGITQNPKPVRLQER